MRAIPWILLLAALGLTAVYLTDSGTSPEDDLGAVVESALDEHAAPTLTGQAGSGALTGVQTRGPVLHVLHGRVENPDGTPVSGVRVTMTRSAPSWGGGTQAQKESSRWQATRVQRLAQGFDAPPVPDQEGETETRADGTFQLDVTRNGNYQVQAIAEAPWSSESHAVSITDTMQVPLIILRLLKGSSLRGRVLSHDDQPVQAYLTAYEDQVVGRAPWSSDPVHTDAKGHFIVPVVPDGKVRLSVTVQGRMRFAPPSIETPSTKEIIIRVPHGSGTIQGRVHDEEGRAIPHATLVLQIQGDNGPVRRRRTTYIAKADGAGAYHIDHVVEGELVQVDGFGPGFMDQTQRPPLALWTGTRITNPTALDIQMIQGGSVSGVVRRGKDGPPLEGATVGLMIAQAQYQAFAAARLFTTGPDGRFVLDGVPSGKHVLIAEHPEHYLLAGENVGTTRTPPQELMVLMPRGGTVIERDLIMAPGLEVSGRVVDEKGQGVGDAEIVAKDYDLRSKSWNWSVVSIGGQGALASTDGNGAFRVRNLAPRDAWELGARKKGYIGTYAESFSLSTTSTPEALQLVLKLGATIEGKVTDDKGEPVVGAWISTWGNQQDIRATWSVTSSRDGTYVFDGVSPGTVTMSVQSRGQSKQMPIKDLKPGEVRRGVDVQLGGGVAVSGVLVDKSDKPVVGQILSLQQTWGSHLGSATTDDEGRFEFKSATKGPVKLMAFANGTQVEVGKPFTAPAEDLRIVYAPTLPLVLEIHVRDAQGEPIPLVAVKVAAAGRNRMNRMPNEQVTDVAHGYVRRAVEARFPITIEAFDARDATGMPLNLKRSVLTLKERPEQAVELRLESGGTLGGTVVAQDNTPIVGATIKAGESTARSDARGAFTLMGLPDKGSVTFTVEPPADFVNPGSQTADVGDEDVVIRLMRGLSIAGTVIKGADTPDFSNGWVNASWKAAGESPAGNASGQVQSNGTFEVKRIPPDVRVTLKVQIWSGQGSNMAPVEVSDVEPGDRNVRVELGGGLIIAGIVLDAEGKPVAGQASINIQNKETKEYKGGAMVGTDGKFEIHGVAPGTYIVQVHLHNNTGRLQPATVEVRPPDRNVRLQLPRAAKLSGRFSPMPSTLKGVTVRAIEVGKTAYGAGGKVNADGTWTFDQIAAGRKWILIAQDTADNTYAKSDSVDSDDTDVVLHLKPGEQIEGRVVDVDGSDLAQGWVMAQADGWWSYVSVKAGNFSIRALPPGSYKLTARSSTSTPDTKPAMAILENVAAGTTGVRLEMKAQ